MTAPNPATIANNIIEEINILIRKGHFSDAASFEVRRLNAEINKLKKADAKAAYTCMAALNQACGNEEKMRDNFKIVRALGYDINNFIDEMTGLCNLGYITEAQAIFMDIARPDRGAYYKLINLGWNILAFNALSAYATRIEQVATDIQKHNFQRIHDASAFLQRHGGTDAMIAEVADIAGQLLREHNLFTSNEPVNTMIDEDLGCMLIEYELQTTPVEAARIHAEFSRRLAKKYEVIPPFIHIDMVARA